MTRTQIDLTWELVTTHMSRPHFLLLDGSYFVFFRYHAMGLWWKRARRADEPEDPLESPRYRESFGRNFSKKVDGLAKLIGHAAKDGPLIGVLAEDCARGTCWRRSVCENYKTTRKQDPGAHAHFELVRREKLFDHPFLRTRLSHPGLEGDDCIAIMVEEIKKKEPLANITIVSSDGDFKQLLGERVRMVDLKGKVTGGEGAGIDPERELFCKAVAGDPSDNIPAILPKCGRKTAEAYYDDPEKLEEKLQACPAAAGLYARNLLLIDFRLIPRPLRDGFRRNCLRLETRT